MIGTLTYGALKQRLVVAVIAVVLLFFGLDITRKLSLDAFPDVTNVQAQIATEAPGHLSEKVERFITVPVEMAMTDLPALTEVRSSDRSGLSLITLVFIDKADVYFARQLVLGQLIEVQSRMPAGVTPVLGPVSTGLGKVYQYTLSKPDDGDKALSVEELTQRRITQGWVMRPLLHSISGVTEISPQSGYEKQYQMLVGPEHLRHHNVTVRQVFGTLAANSANSNGGMLPHFAEQYLVHGVGLMRDANDIGAIMLKEVNGVPLTVRDVTEVKIGTAVRAGAVVKNGVTESVGGIVIMMRDDSTKEVVARIQDRVKTISNDGVLSDGLKIVPYYEHSELVDSTLQTVIKALAEGVVPVVIVLLLFLDDIHSSFIVIGTLILTPLLTFMVMSKPGISADSISLGGLAIAIGLMVDGSVVMMENAFTHLAKPRNPSESRARIILHAVTEVATSMIFGMGIIILVFLPLVTLEGMEGRMFALLVSTIAIALFFSLVLSLTLTPVLSSYPLKSKVPKHVEGEHSDDPHAEYNTHDTWLIRKMKKPYLRLLESSLNNDCKIVIIAMAVFLATGALMPLLGTAFIPEMREGSAVPDINRAPNISLEGSVRMEMKAMRLMIQMPSVKSTVSGVGRDESPADPQGQNESTPIVSLKPRDEWPKGWNQDDTTEAIRKALQVLPGVQIVMAQPIFDHVDEMVTDVHFDMAIKVFDDGLSMLHEKAEAIAKVAQSIQDAQDMHVERITGQQYLQIAIDRQAIARHGLSTADMHGVIETTIGGKEVTEIFKGERRFSAVVHLPDAYRDGVEAIRNLIVIAPSGAQVPIESVAHIDVADGPVQISRELGKRHMVVGVNVRDRDLGSFVTELQTAVVRKIKLPEGYYLRWGGRFQSMERAIRHLKVIAPVTMAAILFLLFLLFNSMHYATLVILILPFTLVGEVIGLSVTGEYLSVPASVGFMALWGIAALDGVMLVSTVHGLHEQGMPVEESVRLGLRMHFRLVMMTAMVAMLDLIPLLFTARPGSEVQRPLAIVMIGGLPTCTLLTLVMLPALYKWFDGESKA